MFIYIESGEIRNDPLLVYIVFEEVQVRIRKSLRGVETSFSVAGDLKERSGPQSSEGCQLLPQLTPRSDVTINVTSIDTAYIVGNDDQITIPYEKKKSIWDKARSLFDCVTKLHNFAKGIELIRTALSVLVEQISVHF